MRKGAHLEPVTQENVRAACMLNMRADHDDLVAPVAWSLADAYTMPDIAWPRPIYDGDELAGFIMAAFAPQPGQARRRRHQRSEPGAGAGYLRTSRK